MKQDILVTGGSGLLALNWAVATRDRLAVTLGLHRRTVALAGVRVREIDLEAPEAALEELQPSSVIHAAGLTSVEECESNPERARHVNVELAVNVARACARFGVPLAHISTDHLFSGREPFAVETDPVTPTNVYGRTKAESEARVLDVYPQALVARTNFFGWGPSYRRSFSDMIVDDLRAGRSVTLFEDVFYTPLLCEVLIRHVHGLLDRKASGIFHVAGDERLSKLEFGRKVAAEFRLDASLIVSGRLGDRADLVRRPSDMSLSNDKARRLLGTELGGIDEQVRRLKLQEELHLCREIRAL